MDGGGTNPGVCMIVCGHVETLAQPERVDLLSLDQRIRMSIYIINCLKYHWKRKFDVVTVELSLWRPLGTSQLQSSSGLSKRCMKSEGIPSGAFVDYPFIFTVSGMTSSPCIFSPQN